MAFDLQRAIQEVLLADAPGPETLAALGLQEYKGGLAVFIQNPTPEDKDDGEPYIYVSPPISSIPFDSKTRNGLEEVVDVQVWDANGPKVSPARLARLVARARKLLHRNDAIPLDLRHVILVDAGGPTELDSAPIYAGRTISVRVRHEDE